MTTVDEHLARLLGTAEPLAPVALPLQRCRGLVLAGEVRARVAVPPFANSAMDGFALGPLEGADEGAGSRGDAAGELAFRVVGECAAGQPPFRALAAGEALRIMTGAPVPPGCRRVVPVELTDAEPGAAPLPERVVVHQLPERSHIRPAGDDLAVDELVLRAGVVLGPAELSAAASTGHGELLVHPRVRVAVLATGSELVDAGEALAPGQIPDSNQVLLAALVEQAGAELVSCEHVVDEGSALLAALARCRQADLVLTSGGVSVGSHDVLHDLAGGGDPSAPRVQVDSIAMQPGKPQGWGSLPRPDGSSALLLALPGNPVAVFTSFHVFVAPVLDVLAGRGRVERTEQVVAGEDFPARAGRRLHRPVALRPGADGRPVALAAGAGLGAGSHQVASLPRADALAVVDTDVAAGEPLTVIPVR